jgi:Asp-tRNA(Asn)/Glu-tRNA(Gln) amidotransferase A subunit family amidase
MYANTPFYSVTNSADVCFVAAVTGELQKRYQGFPMAIQLVGQYQNEPKLMQIALMVDELMQSSR